MLKSRTILKRALSYALCFAMVLTFFPAMNLLGASAADYTTSNLPSGITYNKDTTTGGTHGTHLVTIDKDNLKNGTQKLIAGLTSTTTAGLGIVGIQTVDKIAQNYQGHESNSGVIAGLNVGLFGMNSDSGMGGSLTGIMTQDGEILRGYEYSGWGDEDPVANEQFYVGTDIDGNVIHGVTPDFDYGFTVNGGSTRYNFLNVNSNPSSNSATWDTTTLVTEAYGTAWLARTGSAAGTYKTGNDRDQGKVWELEILSGRIAAGETMVAKVVVAGKAISSYGTVSANAYTRTGQNTYSYETGTFYNVPIGEGRLLLTASTNGSSATRYDGLQEGDVLTFTAVAKAPTNRNYMCGLTADVDLWNSGKVGTVMGVNGPLVYNSAACALLIGTDKTGSGIGTVWGESTVRPRSAIGIKDGNLIFVCVDGNGVDAGGGMSTTQLQNYMLNTLGCEAAYNCDGGGSSTMSIGTSRISVPNDGNKTRSVGNAMLVVDTNAVDTNNYTINGTITKGALDTTEAKAGDTVTIQGYAGFVLGSIEGLAGVPTTIDGRNITFTMPAKNLDIEVEFVPVARGDIKVGSLLNLDPTSGWSSGIDTNGTFGGNGNTTNTAIPCSGGNGSALFYERASGPSAAVDQVFRQHWHLATTASFNHSGSGAVADTSINASDYYIDYDITATVPFTVRLNVTAAESFKNLATIFAAQNGKTTQTYSYIVPPFSSSAGTYVPAGDYSGRIILTDIDANAKTVNGYEPWIGGISTGTFTINKFDYYKKADAYTVNAGAGVFVDPQDWTSVITPDDFTVGQTVVIKFEDSFTDFTGLPAGLDYSVVPGSTYLTFAMPAQNITSAIVGVSGDTEDEPVVIDGTYFLAITDQAQDLSRLTLGSVTADDASVTWGTLPTGITISGDGKLTASAKGAYELTATIGGDVYTVDVYVKDLADTEYTGVKVVVLDEDFNDVDDGYLPDGWIQVRSNGYGYGATQPHGWENLTNVAPAVTVQNEQLVIPASTTHTVVVGLPASIAEYGDYTLSLDMQTGSRMHFGLRTQDVTDIGGYGPSYVLATGVNGDNYLFGVSDRANGIRRPSYFFTAGTGYRLADDVGVTGQPSHVNASALVPYEITMQGASISGKIGGDLFINRDLTEFYTGNYTGFTDGLHAGAAAQGSITFEGGSVGFNTVLDASTGIGPVYKYETGGIQISQYAGAVATYIDNVKVTTPQTVPYDAFPEADWPTTATMAGADPMVTISADGVADRTIDLNRYPDGDLHQLITTNISYRRNVMSSAYILIGADGVVKAIGVVTSGTGASAAQLIPGWEEGDVAIWRGRAAQPSAGHRDEADWLYFEQFEVGDQLTVSITYPNNSPGVKHVIVGSGTSMDDRKGIQKTMGTNDAWGRWLAAAVVDGMVVEIADSMHTNSNPSAVFYSNYDYLLEMGISITDLRKTLMVGTQVEMLSNGAQGILETVAFWNDRFAVTQNIENGKFGVSANTYNKGEAVSLVLVPDAGYDLPDTITMTGVDTYNYDNTTGVVTFTMPAKAVTITATADEGFAFSHGNGYILANVGIEEEHEKIDFATSEGAETGDEGYTYTEVSGDLTITATGITANEAGVHSVKVAKNGCEITLYVFAKEVADTDYVIVDEDFDDVADGDLPVGWTVGGVIGGGVATSVQNGVLNQGKTTGIDLLLPQYVGLLGDYIYKFTGTPVAVGALDIFLRNGEASADGTTSYVVLTRDNSGSGAHESRLLFRYAVGTDYNAGTAQVFNAVTNPAVKVALTATGTATWTYDLLGDNLDVYIEQTPGTKVEFIKGITMPTGSNKRTKGTVGFYNMNASNNPVLIDDVTVTVPGHDAAVNYFPASVKEPNGEPAPTCTCDDDDLVNFICPVHYPADSWTSNTAGGSSHTLQFVNDVLYIEPTAAGGWASSWLWLESELGRIPRDEWADTVLYYDIENTGTGNAHVNWPGNAAQGWIHAAISPIAGGAHISGSVTLEELLIDRVLHIKDPPDTAPVDWVENGWPVGISIQNGGTVKIYELRLVQETEPSSDIPYDFIAEHDASEWTQASAGSSGTVSSITKSGTDLVLVNTGGGWPYALLSSGGPVIPAALVDELSLFIDFTGVADSSPVLWLNDTNEGSGGIYISLKEYFSPGIGAGDLPAGRYTAEIKLSDMIAMASASISGDWNIAGFAMWCVGGNVTIHELVLDYSSEDPDPQYTEFNEYDFLSRDASDWVCDVIDCWGVDCQAAVTKNPDGSLFVENVGAQGWPTADLDLSELLLYAPSAKWDDLYLYYDFTINGEGAITLFTGSSSISLGTILTGAADMAANTYTGSISLADLMVGLSDTDFYLDGVSVNTIGWTAPVNVTIRELRFGPEEDEPITPTELTTYNFLTNPASAWTSTNASGATVAITEVDGNIVVTNNGGNWPSAVLDVTAENIISSPSNWANIYLHFEFVTTGGMRVYLSNDDSVSYDIEITSLIAAASGVTLTGDDLLAGTYKGQISLADIMGSATDPYQMAGIWLQLMSGVLTVKELRFGPYVEPEEPIDPQSFTHDPGYILVNYGDVIDFSDIELTMGDGTIATGDNFTFTPADAAAFTLTANSLSVNTGFAGINKITLTLGEFSYELYVVAKASTEREWVLVDENFNSVASGNLPAGWAAKDFNGLPSLASVNGSGQLVLGVGDNSTTRRAPVVTLPAELVRFADYKISYDLTSDWVAYNHGDLIFRLQNIETGFNGYLAAYLGAQASMTHVLGVFHESMAADDGLPRDKALEQAGLMTAANETVHMTYVIEGTTVTLTYGGTTNTFDITPYYNGVYTDPSSITQGDVYKYETGGVALRGLNGEMIFDNVRVVIPDDSVSGDNTVTIAPTSNGTVTADKTSALEGETVTLSLAAADGYRFAGISFNDVAGVAGTDFILSDLEDQITFTMPDHAVTVKVTFKTVGAKTYDYLRLVDSIDEWEQGFANHNVLITNDPGSNGYIFSHEGCSAAHASYYPNASATAADPVSIPQSQWGDYDLVYDLTVAGTSEWGNGNAASNVAIYSGTTLFKLNHYLAQSTAVEDDDIPSGSYSGTVNLADFLAFFGYTESHFEMTRLQIWVTGYCDDAKNTIRVLELVSTTEVEEVTYKVTAKASPAAGGTVTAKVGDNEVGEVIPGTTVRLSYVANTGYVFKGYTVTVPAGKDAIVISGNSFVMPDYNVIVTANFESTGTLPPTEGAYSLSVKGINGKVTANGTSFDEGDRVTLTLSPNPGYVFETITGLPTGYAFTYNAQRLTISFNMPARDLALTVVFKINESSEGVIGVIDETDKKTSGTTTTATPNNAFLANLIATADKGDTITLVVAGSNLPQDYDSPLPWTYILDLNGFMLEQLADKNLSVKVTCPWGFIEVSADEIRDAFERMYEGGVINDAKFSITLSRPGAEDISGILTNGKSILSTVTLADGINQSDLIAPPVMAAITVTYNAVTKEIILPSGYFRLGIYRDVNASNHYGARLQGDKRTTFVMTKVEISYTDTTTIVFYSPVGGTFLMTKKLNVSLTGLDASWYRTQVNELAKRGIIQGVGNNAFGATQNVMRSDFAQMVTNAMGLLDYGVATADVFVDVKTTSWYADAAVRAKFFGLVTSTSNTESVFSPNNQITRAEVFAIMGRALQFYGFDTNIGEAEIELLLSNFGDGAAVKGWARTETALLIKYGIIQGNNGLLMPNNTIDRASVAVILYNMLDAVDAI